ncbi:MAG: hypothetical protein ICV66_00375 [Chitinophagaceae bacterium]|nr:hypothetical protein [Chitinophagaceae bacterium]
MKHLIFLSFILFTLLACKKIVDKAKDDALTNTITSGQWKMISFMKGTSDVTSDFNPYLFKFLANHTVNAIKDGSVEINGSWQTDIQARTITSFFNNPPYPINFLNGTWSVLDSGENYVIATQTVNGEDWKLRLERQ